MNKPCYNCRKDHPYPSDRWFNISGTIVCKLQTLLPHRVGCQPCKKCHTVGRYRVVLTNHKAWLVCDSCDKFIRLIKQFENSSKAIEELAAMETPPAEVTKRVFKKRALEQAEKRILEMSLANVGKFKFPEKTWRTKEYTGKNADKVEKALVK